MQKPAWNRWLPDIPGNWMNIALVPDGEAFRGSSLIRDQQGVFLYGMVLSIPKTRSVFEFIQMVESALNMADHAQLRLRHIISSHENSFPYRTNQEDKVPWEIINKVRQLNSTYGPLNFHRIPASLNNAALCLAYKGISMFQTRYSHELPLAVRCCITADQPGLPVLSGEDPSIIDYPGGRSVDDSSPAPRSPGGRAENDGIRSTRRSRGFSDDMGLDT